MVEMGYGLSGQCTAFYSMTSTMTYDGRHSWCCILQVSEWRIKIRLVPHRFHSLVDSSAIGRIKAARVGAMIVGSIETMVKEGQQVERGQEFGYLTFGMHSHL